MYLSSLFFYCLIGCTIVKLPYASVITLQDNGYKGIVVAIHKNVPEDLQLLENIKTLFSRASTFLYNSTKNTLFFKEVKIVVPSTWSQRPEYEVLPANFFSNAHIRVDTPNPEYNDTPYTVQPGGCGEPGLYIHLTPWFLKELHGKTVDMFGAPERQLVHEWAHLRYGVFDEYGIPGSKRYPMFYYENGRIRPTSCVRDIKGWIESRDGGPCLMTEDGEVDKDCIFIPNMSDNEAKASIMYMPFIPSMEGFCDDGSHRHNILAPTKHNSICSYRSTWDVITSHKDFQRRSKRDTAENELTETLFRVIQSRPSSRYVLVLDISGSMNGQPMKLLHGAATRLIEDRVQDGAYLGIVQFSTDARILRNLTRVDSVTRKQLSDSLPSKDDGGRTAIGKGLQEAINVLKFANGTAEGGLIMLITDGEENVPPFIENVLPEILEHNVIINAVAFGSDASQKLENMTAVTGGRGYFFSNNGSRPASALDSAFLESITSQADIELQPVQLKDEIFRLDEASISKFVYIDDELGKNTKITVTSPHIQRVADVLLRSPNGTIIDSSSPHYSRDDITAQRIHIHLPTAEPGNWEVFVRRLDEYPIMVSFSVTSEPIDIRNQPIRVRSWLNEIQLKFPAYAKVFAEVKKGYLAVIDASVSATVERPMGPPVDVELRDDGMGADVTKNDGIYTAYFTHFNGNGRYAVFARVTNGGQARLKHGSTGSSSPRIPIGRASTKDVPPSTEFLLDDFVKDERNSTYEDELSNTEAASRFDRSSNSGAFRLESYDPSIRNVIPPGDITDLKVIATFSEKDYYGVTLSFTTPGDDLYDNQADELELRASRNKTELIESFESGTKINETFLVNSTLTPLSPGEKATLTLRIPENLQGRTTEAWSVYFAMKARDEVGNLSSTFNVAETTFGLIIRTRSISSTTRTKLIESKTTPILTHQSSDEEAIKSDEDSKEYSKNESSKWWPIIVGMGVAITVIIIIALITVIIIKKTRMKTYFSVQSQHC